MKRETYFIFANPFKADTVAAAGDLARRLTALGAEVTLDTWLQEKIGIGRALDIANLNEPMAAILSLGGDGTLLRAVPAAVRNQIPLLGINMGHLGFLMEANIESLEEIPRKLMRHSYTIEERMLLQAEAGGIGRYLVMNDLALMRGQNPSSIKVEAYADGERIFTVHGDGVLVSTPTGTTGYSISAGGPVISPALECVAVIPVCSHVLHHRPVVLPATQTIALRMHRQSDRVNQLIIDGQISLPLEDSVEITVRKSDQKAQFIRFAPHQFVTRLRQKQAQWSVE